MKKIVATVVVIAVVAVVFVLAKKHGKPAPAPSGQLWTCSMHRQVIQDHPGQCPICHMELVPVRNQPATAASTPVAQRKIKYWWDPMLGPGSITDKPGKSAMGMDLVPVYEDRATAGAEVVIDPVIVQNMGVRIGEVTKGPLVSQIRAVGVVKEAEGNQYDVNLRVSGWIEKLYANVEGMHVMRGDPLFDLYSPKLHDAVVALISSRGSTTKPVDELAASGTKSLYESAQRNLQLLGLDAKQINELAKLDQAPRVITFTSPITGHIVEKPVVEGSAVTEGMKVLRIVDHSKLWLDAQVYESQLGLVQVGQPASARVEGVGGEIHGEISFIHPHIDPMTRSAMVRMVLDNKSMTLRPGMFGTMLIDAKLADDAILVPSEAVIATGTRELVFIAKGEGHFEPRTIKTGMPSHDGKSAVLEGLKPGDQVVVSGQFLLDTESHLQEAIAKHMRDVETK